MKTLALKPVRERPEYFDAIEKAIRLFFKKQFYQPLMEDLGAKSTQLQNSMDDLWQAIASGQIHYVGNRFEGKFDSAISKELKKLGAVWDRSRKAWSIPRSMLPADIGSAIQASYARFQKMAQRVDRKLEAVTPDELSGQLRLEGLFDTTLYRVNKDLEATLHGITVGPQLTDDQRRRIAAEYTENMQLYIRDFLEKEIKELRTAIAEHAYSGYRYESMIDTIRKSYGVSQRKAKFLARQETSLLMTKFKQVRYQEAGVNDYRWSCVKMPHDKSPEQHTPGNVRYYHGLLDGKVFKWDNPPAVDAKGNKKNPGQDYNCRCAAIPIVRF